jgi:hypothetical protein
VSDRSENPDAATGLKIPLESRYDSGDDVLPTTRKKASTMIRHQLYVKINFFVIAEM